MLGPVEIGPDTVRTIVRFDYARGAEVAADLRAEVIRAATVADVGFRGGRRRPPRPCVRGSTISSRSFSPDRSPAAAGRMGA